MSTLFELRPYVWLKIILHFDGQRRLTLKKTKKFTSECFQGSICHRELSRIRGLTVKFD